MAKKASGEKERPSNDNAKRADIIGASKSLYDGKSYEDGYPDQMKFHINRGGGKDRVKRGGD